jgi:hypothetical protein
MKRFPRIFFLLILILLSPSPIPVHADMAPNPSPGFGGLQPFSYQETQAQMVYERVEMELKQVYSEEHQRDIEIVTVDAWFTLKNRGSTEEKMQAAFPLWDFNYCAYELEIPGPPSYAHFTLDSRTFLVAIDGVNTEFK